MKLTILTPTYNRGYILNRLYESLLNQTDNDFEWLIVDDGSTDDTLNIVESFKKENKLKIRYIRQENGGKHRALNVGICTIESDWTFIVDSDDYLLPEAVHEIFRTHQDFAYDEKRISNDSRL